MAEEFWSTALDRTQAPVPLPFRSDRVVNVVLPRVVPGLSDTERWILQGLESLLDANASALQAELGAPFRCVHDDPGSGQRWFIGPQHCNPALARLGYPPATEPVLHVERAAALIASDAPDVHSLSESFSLLKQLHWDERPQLASRDCASLEEAVTKVVREVGRTWPSFSRLGLSWRDVCARHIPDVLSARDPMPALQAWLAELADGHTRLRSTTPEYPASFSARIIEGRLVLYQVPDGCPAWTAGAREGDSLCVFDVSEPWRRVGASPHHRPFLVAHRLLAGAEGQSRSFSARARDGKLRTWTEAYAPQPLQPVVSWAHLPSGTGYLRVRQWQPGAHTREAIDAAFDDLRGARGLVVDLRGNGGGNGKQATAFRDRFLRERTHLGYRQFTDPFGELTARAPIVGEPAAANERWTKAVRFLTDPLTYSASEDLLLGLSGLPHVEVIGAASGGGSGQARTVRLLPGWLLTVSSCLTFDRQGHCVEGNGIPVDRPVPIPPEGVRAWDQALLAAADRAW